jgi:replicative DNA helicase
VPPPPTLSDIKGAGALKQDADNVLFVYRECDEIGTPQTTSKIWWAKARQGQTGGISAFFNGNRMSFTEQ